MCVYEIWILLLLLISFKISFIKYNYKKTEFTLAKVFLLPEETQPMLCCVITHLISGWYGDGDPLHLEALFHLQLSSPAQTAFIPFFSQVSATLSFSKRSPCATGT